MQNRTAKVTLWVNRGICVLVVGLIFFLPMILDWYCTFRVLTQQERIAITVAFYCCVVLICGALWNVDRLLTDILSQ